MSRYWYTYDGRTVVPTVGTLTLRGVGLYAHADCTATVTWGNGDVEVAAPICKGYHPGFVNAVATASIANTLFVLTQSQIQGNV